MGLPLLSPAGHLAHPSSHHLPVQSQDWAQHWAQAQELSEWKLPLSGVPCILVEDNLAVALAPCHFDAAWSCPARRTSLEWAAGAASLPWAASSGASSGAWDAGAASSWDAGAASAWDAGAASAWDAGAASAWDAGAASAWYCGGSSGASLGVVT